MISPRTLTPLGWLLGAAMVAAIGLAALFGLGFRWDPFDRAGKRADRAEARADGALNNAAARAAEADGARDTARLIERGAADRAAATEIVHRYAIQLEAAPNAPNPDPDPGDDLRDVVDQLCRLRPAVCAGHADPAPARDAGHGAPGLPHPADPR